MTVRLDQTTILDRLEQTDAEFRVDLAIRTLEPTLEERENDLEVFVDKHPDMTLGLQRSLDAQTALIEMLSRVLNYIRIYKDPDKTVKMIDTTYGFWEDQYPDLVFDINYVRDILTGNFEII